jgi:hypothetical protein
MAHQPISPLAHQYINNSSIMAHQPISPLAHQYINMEEKAIAG